MVDFDTNDLQLDIGATEGKRRGDERLRIQFGPSKSLSE